MMAFDCGITWFFLLWIYLEDNRSKLAKRSSRGSFLTGVGESTSRVASQIQKTNFCWYSQNVKVTGLKLKTEFLFKTSFGANNVNSVWKMRKKIRAFRRFLQE